MNLKRTERGPISDWWWTIDRWLLASSLLLMLFGILLSFAASPAVAERIGLDPYHFVIRQIVFMVPAVIALVAVSFLTPRQVRRLSAVLFLVTLVMMVMVLFVGMEIKGSRRWLHIAGFSVQPSEYMKPAFVVMAAWLFAEHMKKAEIPGNIFAIVLFLLVSALLVGQPDLGQTMLVAATFGVLFFLSGLGWVLIAALGVLSAGAAAAAYFSFDHVQSRIHRFLTGEGDNYQVMQAMQAIQHGGWFGVGPGEGIVKRSLPDSHADFVFSVAAEEFGAIFCLVLLAVFTVIVVRGLWLAFRERDEFTRLATCGLVTIFGLQSVINIGVNLQLLPAKGMTLPFVSSGGSSLVATAIGMGMVLALTRHRPEKRAGLELNLSSAPTGALTPAA